MPSINYQFFSLFLPLLSGSIIKVNVNDVIHISSEFFAQKKKKRLTLPVVSGSESIGRATALWRWKLRRPHLAQGCVHLVPPNTKHIKRNQPFKTL